MSSLGNLVEPVVYNSKAVKETLFNDQVQATTDDLSRIAASDYVPTKDVRRALLDMRQHLNFLLDTLPKN
jgi:hypothetical protein